MAFLDADVLPSQRSTPWRCERSCYSDACFHWQVRFYSNYLCRLLISLLSPKNVPAFLDAVKKRQKVLSGFGHRVYKTVRSQSPTDGCLVMIVDYLQSDPRSFIIRKVADEVFAV
jgi:hypothetical protein